MPSLQQQDKVIAILCSDLHLSQKPPRSRRKEPDWFKAMARTLNELKGVSEHYGAPILCGGDVFDHWRADPELVNFAINFLPEMYAIPGQHDLPLHNMDLIERSAYWTMVLIGRITPVYHKQPITIENNIILHAFPWGTTIEPQKEQSKKKHVAICHEYFWTDNHHFHGAPKENEASRYKKKIKGYHAVAYGDNHKGFLTKINGISVLNCGGFMRRTSDQKDYEPSIGLLCASGDIIQHRLQISHEKFTTLEEEEIGIRKVLKSQDMDNFLTGLHETATKSFDFLEAIEYAMKKTYVTDDVRRMILEALGKDK